MTAHELINIQKKLMNNMYIVFGSARFSFFCNAMFILRFSDRAALCQLWRSIILRDKAAMKRYANDLGVKGQLEHWYSH